MQQSDFAVTDEGAEWILKRMRLTACLESQSAAEIIESNRFLNLFAVRDRMLARGWCGVSAMTEGGIELRFKEETCD